MNSASARHTLKKAGIAPVVGSAVLKKSVYLHEDVLSVATVLAAHKSLQARYLNETYQTMAAGRILRESIKTGQTDASILGIRCYQYHGSETLAS